MDEKGVWSSFEQKFFKFYFSIQVTLTDHYLAFLKNMNKIHDFLFIFISMKYIAQGCSSTIFPYMIVHIGLLKIAKMVLEQACVRCFPFKNLIENTRFFCFSFVTIVKLIMITIIILFFYHDKDQTIYILELYLN